jgi:hypothetical protein
MPMHVRAIAERETLEYLLQDYRGADVPVITTAFWSEGGALAAAEPWPDVLSNGGLLAHTQLQPTNQAIEVWRAHYSLSSTQAELLRSVFARKMASAGAPVVLSDREKGLLLDEGLEGLEQTRELLAEAGITLP